jgi:hypothetical protein
MNLNRHSRLPGFWFTLGLFSALALCPLSSRANVYATDVRINGGFNSISASQGDTVTISYILNEPASLVNVDLILGTNLVRRLSFTDAGTRRGLNTVSWDLKDDSGKLAPRGLYSVSVIASSAGYTDWTQITSDLEDPFAMVFDGRGIAVNRNADSQYYGRVYVANADSGFSPETYPGDVLGILKFNADGTAPADGIVNQGGMDGHVWTGAGISPWKVEVSADSFVYVSDLAAGGEVYRWDPTISSNSVIPVLQTNNLQTNVFLSGLAVAGQGAGTQIWMAGTNASQPGVFRWLAVANGVVSSDDPGVTIIGELTNVTDVALDPAGNIYACVSVGQMQDPTPRVFRFRAYDPATNGGLPLLVADWAVGASDDTAGNASGIAVDPSGAFLAVTFQGIDEFGVLNRGNTKILRTSDGSLVTSLDLDKPMNGQPFTQHQNTDCAWDAVGNVYYIDKFFGNWRIFSPPGTNFSATVALGKIDVAGSGGGTTPPKITNISISGAFIVIAFEGEALDLATDFMVLGSAEVPGPYTNATGASITRTGAGQFLATVPTSSGLLYFRLQRTGTADVEPPTITSITKGANSVTLRFSGSTSDQPSSFVVLGSADPASGYSPAANATVQQLTPGNFEASIPATSPVQFYRIQR